MIERTEGSELIESIIVILLIVVGIPLFMIWQGMIVFTPDEPAAIPTITPIETTTVVISTLSPTPTPEAISTLQIIPVDPYLPGLRSENQWYKFYRSDVQGLKDMHIGIVAYRHAFIDKYTWWNPSMGNYAVQYPTEGNRYFAVWIHEEMFGVNQSYDPSFWGFDERAFGVQVKDQIFTSEMNRSYNPVIRIKEFDHMTDYYNTVQPGPFGYSVTYTGRNPESGGYSAQKIGILRMGQGNAHDGYIIYEVPRNTQLKDIMLVGEFGTFGGAQWRFDD